MQERAETGGGERKSSAVADPSLACFFNAGSAAIRGVAREWRDLRLPSTPSVQSSPSLRQQTPHVAVSQGLETVAGPRACASRQSA